MEITSRTRLLAILSEYPFLEEEIVKIAPPFKNLRNPVLRRTVGQLATIERVAQMGNVDVTELVNTLRRAVGQPEISGEAAPLAPPAADAGDPDWTAEEPQFILNGTQMLQQGEVPIQRINELLPQLAADGCILLLTDFEPTPILDTMRQANHRVYHKSHPDDARQHLTYIAR